MSGIINWINSNEGFATVLLSFVSVIATIVYVAATIFIVRKMVTANKLTEEQENKRRRPRVIFDFVIDRRFIFAEIRNEGLTSAIDVSFDVPPDLVEAGKHGEIEFPFTKPISYLSPGSKRRTLLSSVWEFFGKHDNPEFTVRVSHRDDKGKDYSETIYHNLTYMKDIVELGEIYLDEEVKKIRENMYNFKNIASEISKTLKTIANSPPPLRVSVSDARYSQKALAVVQVLVEESEYGIRLDPDLRIEELIEKTKLTLNDVLEAIDELEEGGFVGLRREGSVASDNPSQEVIVEDLLFVEFDRFWMDWDTEEDARRIATDMISDDNFPSGMINASNIKNQEDMLKQMQQIASRYDWKPRRLNPALCWLEKRKLVTLHKVIVTRGYICFAIDGNFPALRRFVKKHRDEQATEG